MDCPSSAIAVRYVRAHMPAARPPLTPRGLPGPPAPLGARLRRAPAALGQERIGSAGVPLTPPLIS